MVRFPDSSVALRQEDAMSNVRSIQSSLIANQARNESFEALQQVKAIRIHLALVWIALIALTLKVCL
jgi:hypothetical protein